jgi:hypothetical protein
MYSPLKVFLLRPKQRVHRIFYKTCNNYCQGSDRSLLLSIHFEAVGILKSRLMISIVVRLFRDIQKGETASYKFLAPIIEERRRMMKYPDFQKPVKSL